MNQGKMEKPLQKSSLCRSKLTTPVPMKKPAFAGAS
jgi:hypothetical protein